MSLEWMNDERIKKAILKRKLSHEVAEMLLDARIEKGWTQEMLAKKMGTHQSSIARAESGSSSPSLTLLEKMAKAYKANLRVFFDFLGDWQPIAVRLASSNSVCASASGNSAGFTFNYPSNVQLSVNNQPAEIGKR